MGISTKLHISNSKYNIEDIAEILSNELLVSDVQKSRPENSSGYYTLQFKLNNKNRNLNIFTNSNVGGLPCMTLDLASDQDSTSLFKSLGLALGGVFVENDCNDQSIVFQDKSKENLEYLVKKAQLEGINSPEEFVNFLKKRY